MEPKPAPPPTPTPVGPAPPVRCLSSLRWLADAGVPTWPQSALRSRCTGVHAAAAQELPRRLGAAGNRGLLCGPAQARTCPPRCRVLRARPGIPQPLHGLATPSRCGHIPRSSGLVHCEKSDTLRSWAAGPALPLRHPTPLPPSEGAVPVWASPCGCPIVLGTWGGGGKRIALGGHVEIEESSSSRSDPAQVRVLRLGPTTSARTCVGGLGFEKLLQNSSMRL